MTNNSDYIRELLLILIGVICLGLGGAIPEAGNAAYILGIAGLMVGILSLVFRFIQVRTGTGLAWPFWLVGLLTTGVGIVVILLNPDGILTGFILYAGLAILASLFFHSAERDRR